MLNRRVIGTNYIIFTCVALAKAGLVPFFCPSVSPQKIWVHINLINIFSFFTGVELGLFFHPKGVSGFCNL